jgi:D-alanyl-D-alanine carboxypeptidase (penicillin-binding protein 5/6)
VDLAAGRTVALRPVPPLLPIGLGVLAITGMVIGGLALRRRHR